MTWPLNPRKAKPDVGYADKAYFAGVKGPGGTWLVRPGSWHTGVDLNGPTGGDSDLGQPVHAVASGLVVFSGLGRGNTWGNLVVLWHEHAKVWTRYAHLEDRLVEAGESVSEGQVIGTIGKGAFNKLTAHLQLDVLVKKPLDAAGRANWSHWPGGDMNQLKTYYADPMRFFGKQLMAEPPRWNGVRHV